LTRGSEFACPYPETIQDMGRWGRQKKINQLDDYRYRLQREIFDKRKKVNLARTGQGGGGLAIKSLSEFRADRGKENFNSLQRKHRD